MNLREKAGGSLALVAMPFFCPAVFMWSLPCTYCGAELGERGV